MLATFETAQLTAAYRDRCEDRACVIDAVDRTVIVVADGAGGIGSGDVVAECVLREIRSGYSRISTTDEWAAELRQIDCRINVGESTAVVVDLRAGGIRGASVGDSQAWIIRDGSIHNLTIHQKRKPLLGSGESCPVGFSHPPLNGILIVASDGFCNYVKREKLPAVIAQTDFFAIPRTCVEMVRLPSGDLWDDIAVVACRARPPHHTRNRYAL